MTTPAMTDTTQRRALAAIDSLRAQLAEARGEAFAPIAVVGMGCRMPGGIHDTQGYWDRLVSGADVVGEVPAQRWDVEEYFSPTGGVGKTVSRWGGFLEDIDQFDPGFFQISAREAAEMDPNQRLVLEVAWQALEDAGAVGHVQGSRTGVFVGVVGTDYATTYFTDPMQLSAHAATGTAHSIISGRLAYLLDLRGPAISVDAACSSSLVTIHQACRSLQARDCDMALAGGVNVMLSPLPSIAFSQFNMMSPTGRCRPFDAQADGFVRSEGCGMVVLKRLDDARREGDRVLAVIRGGAMNQDGRSTGLTAPNVDSQRALLTAALASARLDAGVVSCVEAHGTGTAIGDPIEAAALSDVYRADPGDEWFLGSVKSNLGHLEAAAGVAGFIKVVLGLQHRTIAPTIHFGGLNPLIGPQRVPFVVPTQPVAWPSRQGRRVAGVSAFGLSGTNVHLLVEEADQVPGTRDAQPGHGPEVLPLSAASPAAVVRLAEAHRQWLEDASAPLADHCWSTAAGRAQLPFRAAMCGSSTDEVRAALAGVVEAGESAVRHASSRPPTVGLAVTDPMAWSDQEVADLCQGSARVTGCVERAQERLAGARPATRRMLCAQLALVEKWRELGVTPVVVHGSGTGELVAAVVAGALEVDTAAALIDGFTGGAPDGGPELLETLAPAAPPTRWYSAELGGRVAAQSWRPTNWQRLATATALVGPVTVAEPGCDLLLVLGDPAQVLAEVPVLAAGVPDGGAAFAGTLCRLFEEGARLRWETSPEPPRRRVRVPYTPYERSRVWTAAHASVGHADGSSDVPAVLVADEELPGLDRDTLLEVPADERHDWFARHLAAQVGAALGQTGIDDDWDRPLLELGLDSLMALGIRKQLRADLGVDLSIADLLSDSSVNSITDKVLRGLDDAVPAAAAPVGAAGLDDDLLAQLRNLPMDEVRAMLAEGDQA